ncbi:E3 ubiquitin-protein ligase RNF133 [Saimiri boliviensis]|uniref:E3 ubiquitin-protein ligase RNF133 n=1 Tax=Saimiri boliviensis TaxID=27679 RepID=UPI00027F7543|nr:E3 ubiquitin-protein ligase RNF133 [Saimiri boliviensis boliviensis]
MHLLKIGTWRNNTVSSWLIKFSVLWLVGQNCCRASVWTAYMNISFHVGNHVLSKLGETGIFGRSSTLKRVAGIIVPPEGNTQHACNPNTIFSRSKYSETWLALIERGGCTFTQKIKVATEKGASGVIIYNFPGTGNQVFPMFHQAFEDVVVVMIGNLKGTEIFHLIKKGVIVTAMVEVGRKHTIWVNHYLVSFVIVATATLAYFIFYRIYRLWIARIQNRRWQRLAADLKNAFGQLKLRVLKEGDEEINPNEDRCIICFEFYKPNDIVRILTCKHFFHKNCIDPWILPHGTCPVCKCDILKALGIQVDAENRTEPLQFLMSNELPETLSPSEEETNNEVSPAGTSDKVIHVEVNPASQNNDSQPHLVVEDVHPSP